MKAWKHFCTITRHKCIVMKYCFKVGLYKQALLHDLSKYGWTEFRVGCRYYQGNRSPNNAEREALGYSIAWLHHKGRNRHHYEYWIDYGIGEKIGLTGMKMPLKYVIEMFIDRIAASKNYEREAYTDASALRYYENGKEYLVIHDETRALLEELLQMLADEGEAKTFVYVKMLLHKEKQRV